MSVRVYLKTKSVENLIGFDRVANAEGETRRLSLSDHLIPGVSVKEAQGRYYIVLDQMDDPVPPRLKWMVDGFSFLTNIPMDPIRQIGVYRLRSISRSVLAEAKVDRLLGYATITVLIRSKTLKHLKELWERIRLGTIRPEIPYGDEQAGLSREELEAEVAHLQALRMKAVEDMRGVTKEILTYRDSLAGDLMPLCSRAENHERFARLAAQSAFILQYLSPFQEDVEK